MPTYSLTAESLFIIVVIYEYFGTVMFFNFTNTVGEYMKRS